MKVIVSYKNRNERKIIADPRCFLDPRVEIEAEDGRPEKIEIYYGKENAPLSVDCSQLPEDFKRIYFICRGVHWLPRAATGKKIFIYGRRSKRWI